MLRDAIGQRMVEVGLQLHPDKTRIVYCKDSNRRREVPQCLVHVLGVYFPSSQGAERAEGECSFTSFQPAMSRDKLVEKGREVRGWRLHRRPNDSLDDLAEAINPIVRGWMTYWGRFYRTEMDPLLKRINTYLMRWARKKYKRLRGFKRLKAWWEGVTQRDPDLFAHWAWTHVSTRLDGKSGVTGDCYARFRGSPGLRCPRATRHLGEQGFDFLGFNVRRYGSKLLIKPSKAAIRRLRQRLAFEMRVLRGSNSAAVIARLNPIIKGWAAYYRGVVSSKVFHTLDYQMWKLTYKWATWQHNNKPKRWIVEHYFGKRNKFRNDRWVFGDPGSNAYLVKFSWTDIVRHVMVQGAASPDDPALADYWAERRRKVKPPLDNYTLRLLARQDARCPLCGDHLLTAEQPPQSPNDWEQWWQQVTRQAIAADYLVHHGRSGPPHNDQTRLVHASCRRGLRARQRRTQHS